MSWRVPGVCVEQAAFDGAGLVSVRAQIWAVRRGEAMWPGTMILP